MENVLRQKYKLPKSGARSIVAEAKSFLRLPAEITFSKPLEHKCVKIAEERGFLKNGKPVEKKPQRTHWVPSQPTIKGNDVRNRVDEMLSNPSAAERLSSTKDKKQQESQSKLTKTRSSDRCPSTRPHSIPQPAKSFEKSRNIGSILERSCPKSPISSTPTERPRRSRFVPSARVSKVLDPIAEASYSTDESSVGSASTRRSGRRRPPRRNCSLDTHNSCASAITECLSEEPLREHILRIVGDCIEIDVVSDHVKGFRYTDFDSRSYTSATVSTDGESISSSGSGWQWGSSPRRISEASRKTVSMGPATVKSLAMRFESGGSDCMIAAPPRPVRRCSNDDIDPDVLPRRLHTNEPPILVVETSTILLPGYPR